MLRVSFRPADVQSGTILYSLTPTSKHELTVSVNSQVLFVQGTISHFIPPYNVVFAKRVYCLVF